MTKIALAAMLAAPLAAFAADANADTVAVLAVADPPGPAQDLAELSAALRSALAERAPGIVSADELRQRMRGVTSAASLSELDRAYAGAVAASQAGDYEGAARTLRAIIQDLERMPESDDAFAQWTRAMLRLARAEGSLGRKGESHDILERLLRADPGAKADPELYPPSFARQLDEIRAALRAGPKRKLSVTTGGRTARVFVEGKDAGAAPLSVSLPPGRYRISGVAGDVRVAGGVVDLTQEDQAVVLDLALAESFKPGAGPGLAVAAKQRPKAIITASATLKLDRIYAASIVADGDVRFLVGSVYDIRRGMLEREGRLRLAGTSAPTGGLQAMAAFLVTGEPSTLVITKPDLSVAPPPPPSVVTGVAGPQKSKALGWTSIGAAGVALGLGAFAVYEGMTASSKYQDADNLKASGIYDFNEYNRLIDQGDAAKKNAWIAGGGAAIAGITSGVLGYLSYKQTGEIGPFRF